MEKYYDEEELNVVLDYFNIKQVDANRRYWLVRTQGGIYFNNFYLGGYIAVDWNLIDNIELIHDASKDSDRKTELKNIIIENYPEETRPGNIVNQLCRFVNEMKAGDIVLIPSEGSNFLGFGELVEDEIYVISKEKAMSEEANNKCNFLKRRKVKWLKHIKKNELDVNINSLLNSRYAITKADNYAPFIDRSLYNFFQKKDKVHVVLNIRDDNEIRALDMVKLIHNMIYSIDIFNKITKSNFDKSSIDLKMNINSPGTIEFAGWIPTGLIIGVLVIAVVGGSIKFKHNKEETDVEIKSDGLIEKILKTIKVIHQNRLSKEEMEWKKEVFQSVQTLNVKTPGFGEDE